MSLAPFVSLEASAPPLLKRRVWLSGVKKSCEKAKEGLFASVPLGMAVMSDVVCAARLRTKMLSDTVGAPEASGGGGGLLVRSVARASKASCLLSGLKANEVTLPAERLP